MNVKEVFNNYILNNIEFIKENNNDKFLKEFPINSLKEKIKISDEYCNLLDVSEWLISNGIDVNEKDEDGNNGLINAILLNNYSYFNLFIKNGIDIKEKSSKGLSPLMIALSKEYYCEYMVKILVDLGVDLNERCICNGKKYSPLLIAASNDNIDILRYLLYHGAKVEKQSDLLKQFSFSDRVNKILNEFDDDLYDLIINWYDNYNPVRMPSLLEFFNNVRNRYMTRMEFQIFGELGKRIKDIDYRFEIYKLIYEKEISFFKKYFKENPKGNNITILPSYIKENNGVLFDIINPQSVDDLNKIRKKKIDFDSKGNVVNYVYNYITCDNHQMTYNVECESFNQCKNAILNRLGLCDVTYEQMNINYTKDELLLNLDEIYGCYLYLWDKEFNNDDDIIYYLLDKWPIYIEYIDESSPFFKKYLYFCLRREPYFIKKLSLDYRGNMDVFLFIARHCPSSDTLRFATEKLKKNEEYRKKLQELDESFLCFTETIKDKKERKIRNEEIKEQIKEQREKEVFERVKRDPSYYKLVSDEFRRSRSLALLAIKGDASNILSVSTAFRNNIYFINEAREINPNIDKYFNKVENTGLDIDIKNKIIDIIRKYSESDYKMPIALRSFFLRYSDLPMTIFELIEAGEEDIVLDLFGDLGRYFIEYYDKFDDDILFEIYLADICHDPTCRTRIPPEKTHIAVKILNDKNVIKKLMLINGRELDMYRKEFRDDKDIVLAAVSSNWHATKYISELLQNDKDVILQALNTKYRDSEIFIGKSLQNDKDIMALIDKMDKKEKKAIVWV